MDQLGHGLENAPACVDGDDQLLPGWVCVRRTVVRRLEEQVHPETFLSQYYRTGVPVVLAGVGVQQWHVFRNDGWAVDKLQKR
jgi:hypothetical protein